MIRVLVAVFFFFSCVLNLKLQLLRLQEISQLFEILFSFLAWRLVIDIVIGDVNPNSSFAGFLANLKAFRLRIVMLLLGPCVMMQEFLFSFFFPAVFARS